MFKQAIKLRASRCLTTLQAKNSTLPEQVKEPQPVKPMKKWDLYSAVYLERHPVIIKPLTDIEQRYMEMLQMVEFERSHLSNFELRQKAEEEAATQKVDMDSFTEISAQTAQDFLDAAMAEFNKFQFAPTLTESDKSGDLTSVDRKLASCLVFLTKHNYTKPVFIPPQGPRLEGETMRQAAERILAQACGPDLKARFYGNAPIGFYKYVYPRAIRESGTYGAKVFYFLAKYISGQPRGKEHLWLDQVELSERLPENVHKCVVQFRVAT